MGRGGPQPAHQVRPGDLQMEEAVVDLEDPEVFGHVVAHACQFMSNNVVSHMVEGSRESLDEDDDADDDDDAENVDDDEVQNGVCEGPSIIIIQNLNNNAMESRESKRSLWLVALTKMGGLFHGIDQKDRRKSEHTAKKRKRKLENVAVMNSNDNNNYLRSIQEEEEEEESTKHEGERCRGNSRKNNRDDPALVTDGDRGNGAQPKNRFHGGRRQMYGLWRNKVCGASRQPNTCYQQSNLWTDSQCDYKEFRKGMGDVVNDTSGLDNVATINDNNKDEVKPTACEFQSSENGKVSGGPLIPHEDMDNTTAAEFSSFLDPGSSCWDIDNGSQTTLPDEGTLTSFSSPQEYEDEQEALYHEKNNVCQESGEPTPHAVNNIPCLWNSENADAKTAFVDRTQVPNLLGEKVADLSVKENRCSRQMRSTDEQAVNNLTPEGQTNNNDHTFSLAPGKYTESSGLYTGSNCNSLKESKHVQIESLVQINSFVEQSINSSVGSLKPKCGCADDYSTKCDKNVTHDCKLPGVSRAATSETTRSISGDGTMVRERVNTTTYNVSSTEHVQCNAHSAFVVNCRVLKTPSSENMQYNAAASGTVLSTTPSENVQRRGRITLVSKSDLQEKSSPSNKHIILENSHVNREYQCNQETSGVDKLRVNDTQGILFRKRNTLSNSRSHLENNSNNVKEDNISCLCIDNTANNGTKSLNKQAKKAERKRRSPGGSFDSSCREKKFRMTSSVDKVYNDSAVSVKTGDREHPSVHKRLKLVQDNDDRSIVRKSSVCVEQFTFDNLTQNHTNSREIEEIDKIESPENCEREKRSRHRLERRIKRHGRLKLSSTVAELSKAIEQDVKDIEKEEQFIQPTNRGINKNRNVPDGKQDTSEEIQLLATKGRSSDMMAVTVTSQCQTSNPCLTSASIQCHISESQATSEDRGAIITFMPELTTTDSIISASHAVLSKRESRRSQIHNGSISQFSPKNNQVNTNVTSVRHEQSCNSHKRLYGRVCLPKLREPCGTYSKQYQAQANEECYTANNAQLKIVPGLYGKLNKDLVYHVNKRFSYNLVKDVSNRLTLASTFATNTRRRTSQDQAKWSFRHSKFKVSLNRRTNANVNSTSRYKAPGEQDDDDDDEVTVKISSDSQSHNGTTIPSSSSTAPKIPTAAGKTRKKDGQKGILSYFGSRFFKSSVETGESSVDGDDYPLKKVTCPPVSAKSRQASKSFEDERLSSVCHSSGKEQIQYIDTRSDGRPCLTEDQAKVMHEKPARRKTEPLVQVREDLIIRYNTETPYRKKLEHRNTILPKISEKTFLENEYEKGNISRPPSANLIDSNGGEMNNATFRTMPAGERFYSGNRPHGYREWYQTYYNTQNEWRPQMSSTSRYVHNIPLYTVEEDMRGNRHWPYQRQERFDSEKTTYRDTFQDPGLFGSSLQMLNSSQRFHEGLRVNQRSNLMESSKMFPTTYAEDYNIPQTIHGNHKQYGLWAPPEAFAYGLQNKFQNLGSRWVSGSPVDNNKRVLFSDNHRSMSSLRQGELPGGLDEFAKQQRSKSMPPSYVYQDIHVDHEDFRKRYVPASRDDKWSMNLKSHNKPTTTLDTERFTEPQVLTARVLAESYYDPTTNVINVVVKPVNTELSRKLKNIRVKVYRSPPQLSSFPTVRKRGKESTRKKPYPSFPASRDVIDRRAANPPFNTATTEEANERYRRIFGHRKIL